jgi:hypothetical protein
LVETQSSIEDNLQETSILIFPNPSSDFIFIEGNFSPGSEVRIFDSIGRLVMVKTLERRLSIQSLEVGNYILVVNGNKAQQFIKH